MQFIPINRPLIVGNEKKYLLDCINSGYISSVGKYVKKFDLNYYGITPSFHILSKKNIAPYKLKITRLSKIGLHKIIYTLLQSKTESDHYMMTKKS